ncbi:MAG TPA: CHAT domain-containing protein [Pyrinomonadaceae bacterium]|nr:CHAT domain-containing protein [Pyrinomonadaceae bacterium]
MSPVASQRSRFVFAVLSAVVIIVGGALLLRCSRNTDIERGLRALNEAYKQQRPGEARITGLGYAPAPATRGAAADKFDAVARDHAERLLRDAADTQKSAAAQHALGRLYLAEREYDKAIKQLETALAAKPDDARLHSDLGAALMERGNNRPAGKNDGEKLLDFARALEHLNRALALDPSLLDPLFNRGLLHESMNLPGQAADDWRRYIDLDSKTPWAEEGRRNLKQLEERRQLAREAPEILRQFLDAYRARSDDLAWQLMSGSREMITGKMIPFQLTRGIAQAASEGRTSEAGELIDALKYAGTLERSRTDDPFVAELATYYSKIGRDNQKQLVSAHAELSEGYRLCKSGQYDPALPHFSTAKSLFTSAGNKGEARVVDYWIAYTVAQSDRLQESATLTDDLALFAKSRNYRWLHSQALVLLANTYDLLGDHSRSIGRDRQAFEIADALNDTYNQQKILTQLALQYTQLGRPDYALQYHQRTLSIAAAAPSSPRQDWRNFTYTAQTFYTLKQYDAAAAYETEALRLSLEQERDPSYAWDSYTHLGMILAGQKRFDEAIKQATAGLNLARSLQNDSSSRKMIAYSLLKLGHLRRQSGDCNQALESYNEALKTYEGMEISGLDAYDTHKGRLLCYLNGTDDAATEAELARVLDLFELDRARITDQQNRNSFFDAESVYDIAIAYAYARGDKRRAFNYSEQSRARSLLDMLTHSVETEDESAEPELPVGMTASPLDLDTTRAKLPVGMQVVQYTALKDKLLIWLVSSSRFEVIEKPVTAAELNRQVLEYVALLTRNDASQAAEVKRRAESLYELLFAPVAPLLDREFEIGIVPDKALYHLPFNALVASATGHYLVEDYTLLFAPSASVLVHFSRIAEERARMQGTETLLSVGNPAFDRAVYSDLADLPSAEVEAKKIAQLYQGAPALTGARAQKAAFVERLSQADVIHFAGHYVADERSPMRSRLLLAHDEALTAAEVFGKKLPRARLVVLSACQTEFEGYDSGEGMIGIARTFLAAGAPLVVASQWPVDSDATAELMIRFHRLRKLEGLTTTRALRRAQQEMLSSPDERHRNPYYWAAFLPVGGHAEY